MMGGESLLSSYCATRDKANLFADGAHGVSKVAVVAGTVDTFLQEVKVIDTAAVAGIERAR